MGLLDWFKGSNPEMQMKANSINYDKIVDALIKWADGKAASIPQNSLAYINDVYFTNDHVYAVVRLLSRSASMLPIYLYKVKDKKKLTRYKAIMKSQNPDFVRAEVIKSQALEEVTTHPILKILAKPNALQGQAEFIENAIGFKLVTGNSFLLGLSPETGPNAGKFVSLEVLPSQYVDIILGQNLIKEYQLKINGTSKTFDPKDVCHIKYWSPDYSSPGSHLYGVSPIRAGRNKIKMGNDSATTMVQMLQNMGMFGMFTLKEDGAELGETQAQILEQKFYQKQRQKGRVMFANGNFTWQTAGMSPVDLAILEANKTSLRDVCNIYSVSSQLLNDPENKTYNNMKEARKAMWTNAVLPDFYALLDELNRWWVSQYDDTLILDTDLQAIPELQEDFDKLVGYVKEMYWAKIDEQRAMCGLDSAQGSIGGMYAMPGNRILLDGSGKMQTSVASSKFDKEWEEWIKQGRY